ncbi:hypothetical protein CERZMDRAFT_88072 [Cercospora zeae-maydis SCOH1-5]|uniref:Uncharacterized protein n=1 Tax=Cercospora zeae-maydis SCOH1-5 TaxID=717836 RepID=A0A6A6F4A5_9PEZI|nr:hypothetical protein CERZMDRAFT_88072 [Cercospora zeae-maydis SCOH1-5]
MADPRVPQMQYFENVSKRELLNGGKAIRFSARSIRTMLVFCARHQVSVRNQPSPALLNRLLGALDVPDDASARLWEVIGVKVLRAIDYHVSSNVQNQALREARGKDGVWRCTWKEWSKRWLQRDWDGEVQQPADVEEREQHERPVVRLRHALNRDQLAAAAAALRRRESGDAVDDEESDDVDDEQSGDADDEESGDAEDEESEDADDEQSDDDCRSLDSLERDGYHQAGSRVPSVGVSLTPPCMSLVVHDMNGVLHALHAVLCPMSFTIPPSLSCPPRMLLHSVCHLSPVTSCSPRHHCSARLSAAMEVDGVPLARHVAFNFEARPLMYQLPSPPPEPHGLQEKLQRLRETRAEKRSRRQRHQRSKNGTATPLAAAVVVLAVAVVLYMLLVVLRHRTDYWETLNEARAARCQALPDFRHLPSDDHLLSTDEPTILAAFDTIISDSPALRAYLSTSSTLGHDLRVELAFIVDQLTAPTTTAAIANLKLTNTSYRPPPPAWIRLQHLHWEYSLLSLLSSASHSSATAPSSFPADPALDLALHQAEIYHSNRQPHFQVLETTLGPVIQAFVRASKLWEMLRIAVESPRFRAQWQQQQQPPTAWEAHADTGAARLRQLEMRVIDHMWPQATSWKDLADQSAGRKCHGHSRKLGPMNAAWTAEQEARCWARINKSLTAP